jgi:SAM-dependent methyltransferase
MSYAHLFTKQSGSYSKFRPSYPEALFDFLAEECPRRELVWDVGTGNGQAARSLAHRFDKVIATDVAEAQIAAATPEPRVTFLVSPAEKSPLESGTADLVSVAQALHWFHLDAFYAEVRRVLRPGGLIAVWTYGWFTTDEPLHSLVDNYGKVFLGPYWTSRSKIVEEGYRSLPFPFAEVQAPRFQMSADWTYPQLRGYLDSWSATQLYKDREGGKDPYDTVRSRIEEAWGDPDRIHPIVWDLTLKVGRV